MSVERAILSKPFPADPAHAPLLRMLLALDGSTTRVCEALARAPIEVRLHHQQRVEQAPAALREQLGGNAWLERVTSLHVNGEVLMDNLSYTRLDAVPPDFLRGLDAGQAPIGHLLQQLFVQRKPIALTDVIDEGIAPRLWQHVGEPDLRASRCYRIVTLDGPLMLIFEAYRSGMARQDTDQAIAR